MSKLKNRFMNVWVMLYLIGISEPSHAQTIEGIISSATSYLQGSLARAIGIFAIIVAGYMCIVRQRFPKEYFMMILVGMGIIFGGSSLYSKIIG